MLRAPSAQPRFLTGCPRPVVAPECSSLGVSPHMSLEVDPVYHISWVPGCSLAGTSLLLVFGLEIGA